MPQGRENHGQAKEKGKDEHVRGASRRQQMLIPSIEGIKLLFWYINDDNYRQCYKRNIVDK
jgi:hypothetical protein